MGRRKLPEEISDLRMTMYKDGKGDIDIAKAESELTGRIVTNHAILQWRKDRNLPSNSSHGGTRANAGRKGRQRGQPCACDTCQSTFDCQCHENCKKKNTCVRECLIVIQQRLHREQVANDNQIEPIKAYKGGTIPSWHRHRGNPRLWI